MVKLWIDDVRLPPPGYVWCKSVNQAKKFILDTEACIDRCMARGARCFQERNYIGRTHAYRAAKSIDIEVIDIDHDAGDYAYDGGDYIKLLDWLEVTGRKHYPIHIHSMNPVGVQNMRTIIKRNGWKEVQYEDIF